VSHLCFAPTELGLFSIDVAINILLLRSLKTLLVVDSVQSVDKRLTTHNHASPNFPGHRCRRKFIARYLPKTPLVRIPKSLKRLNVITMRSWRTCNPPVHSKYAVA
jgi:hypothetical protein